RVRPPAPELARASERTAWLHDLSRVRAPLAALERIDRATRESTRTPLPMQVWAPSQGLRLVVVGTPGEVALRGLLLDAWTEAIPRPDTTTGIAFHYDAPGARAPNAIL